MSEASHKLKRLKLCLVVVGQRSRADLDAGILPVQVCRPPIRRDGAHDGIEHPVGDPRLLPLHMADDLVLESPQGRRLLLCSSGALQL